MSGRAGRDWILACFCIKNIIIICVFSRIKDSVVINIFFAALIIINTKSSKISRTINASFICAGFSGYNNIAGKVAIQTIKISSRTSIK